MRGWVITGKRYRFPAYLHASSAFAASAGINHLSTARTAMTTPPGSLVTSIELNNFTYYGT